MNKLKELFENISSGKGRSIQLKIFGILFFFLIIQASFQLYENVNQGKYALQEMTDIMHSGMKESSDRGNKQLRAVKKSRISNIDTMSHSIVNTIRYAMLQGHAEMVRGALEMMGEDKRFLEISLYRANKKRGEKAFRNNATINTVNKNLDEKRFTRHKLEPAELFDSSRTAEFNKVASGSSTTVKYESKVGGEDALTGLYGIANDDECQYCHGENHKVRGVLKVSISVSESKMLEASIRKELDAKRRTQADVRRELKAKTKRTKSLSIFAALFLTVITLAATNLFLRFTVVKPVNAISKAAGNIAEGDLTVSIDTSRSDEIGTLSGSLAKMQISLKEMIDKINDSSGQVSDSASELVNLSNHMAVGSGKQADQADRVATAVEEMTATILDIAKNSNDALDSSTQAKETAEKGAVAVENTVDGIHKISSAMEKSSRLVGTLGENSEEISKIISVIDDIADQTNLLALNAAIEAARAGEAGRGFAVVADEVRKLAERTTKATKEIASMISKIQSDTTEAVESMEVVMVEVKNEVELADETGKSLSQIVDQVQNTAFMVERIATASEEQSTTVEEISRNVHTVAEVSKETGSDTQKTSNSAQNLQKLASELKTLVGQFKV